MYDSKNKDHLAFHKDYEKWKKIRKGRSLKNLRKDTVEWNKKYDDYWKIIPKKSEEHEYNRVSFGLDLLHLVTYSLWIEQFYSQKLEQELEKQKSKTKKAIVKKKTAAKTSRTKKKTEPYIKSYRH